MCGIGGIYLRNKSTLNSKDLEKMWNNLEDRGKHASGIAYLWEDADRPIVSKGAKSASQHSSKIIDEMGKMVHYALLHTRYTTQGSTALNGNNHPVVRDSIIMTHNGVISNDWRMFETMGVTPKFEVDTEALVAGIETNGLEWTANVAKGSMSIAWVDTNDVTQVNLFTNGRNPLVIANLECGSTIWASGYHHLKHYKPVQYIHAVPGTLYKITPKGIITEKISGDWPKQANVLSTRYYGRVY